MAGAIPLPAEEQAAAWFSRINREVETFPDGKPDNRSFAKRQTNLQMADHVATGEDSTAILAFADLSTFLLKPESEIVLESPPDQDGKVGRRRAERLASPTMNWPPNTPISKTSSKVCFRHEPKYTVSDSSGDYSILLTPGDYTVVVWVNNFQYKTFKATVW